MKLVVSCNHDGARDDLGAILAGLAVVGQVVTLAEQHPILLKVPAVQGSIAHRAPETIGMPHRVKRLETLLVLNHI